MKQRFENFTIQIAKISRNIKRIKGHEMQEYDLRSSHVSCLYYLFSSKGLTLTELSERCEEDKATVSRSVRDLKRNGYVISEAGSEGRYKAQLLLTEKGMIAGKRIADKISAVLNETDKALTGEELEVFYRCLGVISEELEKIADRHG